MPDIGFIDLDEKHQRGPTKSESFNKSWLYSTMWYRFVHNQRSESTAYTSFYTVFPYNSGNDQLCADIYYVLGTYGLYIKNK